jgi:YVTN family beta-propeller protein
MSIAVGSILNPAIPIPVIPQPYTVGFRSGGQLSDSRFVNQLNIANDLLMSQTSGRFGRGIPCIVETGMPIKSVLPVLAKMVGATYDGVANPPSGFEYELQLTYPTESPSNAYYVGVCSSAYLVSDSKNSGLTISWNGSSWTLTQTSSGIVQTFSGEYNIAAKATPAGPNDVSGFFVCLIDENGVMWGSTVLFNESADVAGTWYPRNVNNLTMGFSPSDTTLSTSYTAPIMAMYVGPLIQAYDSATSTAVADTFIIDGFQAGPYNSDMANNPFIGPAIVNTPLGILGSEGWVNLSPSVPAAPSSGVSYQTSVLYIDTGNLGTALNGDWIVSSGTVITSAAHVEFETTYPSFPVDGIPGYIITTTVTSGGITNMRILDIRYFSSETTEKPRVLYSAQSSSISVVGTAVSTPDRIAIDETIRTVYIPNFGAGTVLAQNLDTYTTYTTITVGANPYCVGVNRTTHTAYCSNNGTSTVSVIDETTNAVTATVAVGSTPRQLAVNEATNTIYVANAGSASVSVIDGATNAVTTTVTVGTNPWGVAVNAITNMVYVANNGSDTVSIIDGSNNTVTGTIGVGSGPSDCFMDESTNTLYVTNNSGSTLTVIDCNTTLVTATITLDEAPTGLFMDSLTRYLYICCSLGRIDVVDTVTLKIAYKLLTPTLTPYGVSVDPFTGNVWVSTGTGTTLYVYNPILL